MQKKTIIITGASRGIGRAIARKLVAHNLVLLATNHNLLQQLADEINQQGGSALPLVCDVTSEKDVTQAIKAAVDTFSTVDVVINNAGIGSFKRVDEFSLAEFEKIQRVNLSGTFLVCKAVAPLFIEKKQGQIINISSVAGLNGFRTGTAYAASKFAVVGFSESLREDLKEFGIAVTVVCPGTVATEFGDSDLKKLQSSEYVLLPEDVAHTIQYLLEESEYSNTKLIELKPRRRKEFR